MSATVVLHSAFFNTPAVEQDPGERAVEYMALTELFAEAMRKQLHDNAFKGGRPSWKTADPKLLIKEVYYHTGKLHHALMKESTLEEIEEYAADVANCAMFILDMAGGLENPVSDIAKKLEGKKVEVISSSYTTAQAL